MQLYTVRFTTKHNVTRYDDKGQAIGSYDAEIPQVVSALPHATAMSYARFGNFQIEPYQIEVRGDRKAHKAQPRRDYDAERDTQPKTKAKSRPAQTSLQQAAATGDMSAAINARN
jgi:hypothetical protein